MQEETQKHISHIQNLLESNDTENINLAFQLMEGLGLQKQILGLYGIMELEVQENIIKFGADNYDIAKKISIPILTTHNNSLNYIDIVILSTLLIEDYFHTNKLYHNSLSEFKLILFFEKILRINLEFVGIKEQMIFKIEIFKSIIENSLTEERSKELFSKIQRKNIGKENSDYHKYSLFLQGMEYSFQLLSKNPEKASFNYEVIPINEEYSKLYLQIDITDYNLIMY